MITLAYEIKTEHFKGPLDLLLHFIEERKLSINEVSLAEVSTQYLDYMKSFQDLPRREAAYFLIIASTLMLIKSKSLLPTFELTEEEQESVEDLEKRLNMYKKTQELSLNIESLYGKNIIYSREAFFGVAPIDFVEPTGVGISILCDLLKNILNVLPIKEDLPEKAVFEIIKIEDKISELSRRIEKAFTTSFHDFAGEKKDKVNVVISFLAMLELVKQGFIAVKQDEHFGDIEMFKLE